MSERSPIDRVLAAMPNLRGSGEKFSGPCPAHEDHNPSLSVTVAKDGKVLITCHRGCPLDAILAAVGLDKADLFPPKDREPAARIVATYSYCRPGEKVPVVQKVRKEPKAFLLRRPDGVGGWLYNTNGVSDYPLYQEAMVRGAIAEGLPVWVVEGEKDADTLTELGEVATTNIGGALKWRPSDTMALAGAEKVVVVADRDEPGYRHARQVREALMAAGIAQVDVLESDRAKDVTEHFALGGTFDDFRPARPEPAPTAAVSELAVSVNLSTIDPGRPQWLWEDRIAYGAINLWDGDPGATKSTGTLDIAARVTNGAPMPLDGPGIARPVGDVVLLSAEDSPSDTIVPRLLAAGANRERVHLMTGANHRDSEGHLTCGPVELPRDVGALTELVVNTKARLVVIDVLVAYLGMTNTWRDGDVRAALTPLAAMAEATGVAVLAVRHLSKGSLGGPALYRGGGSIGITGAARVVLMAGRDPTDSEGQRRVLAVAKNNLAPIPRSITYEVVGDPMWHASRIKWGRTCDVAADDLGWKPGKGGEKRADIGEWLAAILAQGPMAWAELRTLGRHEGFSESYLRQVADDIGVVKERQGFGKDMHSTWRLPGPPGGDDA